MTETSVETLRRLAGEHEARGELTSAKWMRAGADLGEETAARRLSVMRLVGNAAKKIVEGRA